MVRVPMVREQYVEEKNPSIILLPSNMKYA
jgi:hypothetical protein